LAKHRPDILITRTLPSEATLCDWYAAMPSPPAIILVEQLLTTTFKTIGGIRVYQPEEKLDIHPDLWALQLAERISTRKLAIPAMSASRPKNKHVILVGAGIVNLITAFYLVRADYHVVIIDALQDPRDNGHWSDYGCSHGGHDARMFTLTEADSYHDQSPPQKGKKHNSLFRNVVGNLGIEDTARHFFPAAYNQAQADGSLKAQRRYCIRPWTATGLGIFESMQTAQDGLLIITGGHNTGGFAQAPAIGTAVLASLQGKHHPMQTLYHPARYSAFTNTTEQPLLCV
jgi:hypothetical protein